MNKYEMAIILNASLEDELLKEEIEKVHGIISRFEGTIDKIDDWGKRRMAYEIQKINEGLYSFFYFSGAPNVPAEIESRVRIMENILRYLIVRMEA